MQDLITAGTAAAFLVAWVVLQRWVLPRFGVGT